MDKKQTNRKRTGKQTAALLCVILIAVMLLATLLTAIFDPTGMWFRSCLILTIAVPILSWVCIWLYGLTTQKHSIASVDLLQTGDEKAPLPDPSDASGTDLPNSAPEDSCDK